MSNFPLISQNTQNSVSNFYLNMADILNSTGLYNYLRENEFYQQAKHEFSDFLVTSMERSQNEKFHNSLNFFEKLGFVSNAKWQRHQQKIGLLKGLTSFTSLTALSLLPAVIDVVSRERKFANISEFLIGWLAYINKQNSIVIQKRVLQFLLACKYDLSADKYLRIFEKYVNSGQIRIPGLSFSNREFGYQLFHLILSASDLSDVNVAKRAEECGDYLGIGEVEMRDILQNVYHNQTLVSDLSVFSGLSIPCLFEDLSQNFAHARECGFYSIENDPFCQEREKNKKIIAQSVKLSVPLVFGGVSFFTGEIGDFLLFAAIPVINKLINEKVDIDKTIEIATRMKNFRQKL